jgi:hypothetical protein
MAVACLCRLFSARDRHLIQSISGKPLMLFPFSSCVALRENDRKQLLLTVAMIPMSIDAGAVAGAFAL